MQQLKNKIVVVENSQLSNKYKDDIINIWETSFGDNREYINLFLEHNISWDCLLYIKDEIAVSMLFLIDCSLSAEKKGQINGKYVYAVATLPQHRNKGYTTELLDFANSRFSNDKSYDYTVLVPSEKGLFNFYGKRGYETILFCDKGIYKKSKSTFAHEMNISNVLPVNYSKIRNEFLKSNFVRWDERFIEYCFEENEFCGGKQIVVTQNEKIIAIAILIKDKSVLNIKEIVFADVFLDKFCVFDFLLHHFGCDEIQYRCNYPENSLCKQPLGMIKWGKEESQKIEDSYMGLVLD
ncbi:MAG: GNAT family N-acetyltransferase [Oscillospiraceae bacterium]